MRHCEGVVCYSHWLLAAMRSMRVSVVMIGISHSIPGSAWMDYSKLDVSATAQTSSVVVLRGGSTAMSRRVRSLRRRGPSGPNEWNLWNQCDRMIGLDGWVDQMGRMNGPNGRAGARTGDGNE